MKTLTFQGSADVRVLDSNDVPDLTGEYRFPKGVGVEVNEAAAKKIFENPDVYGIFTISEDAPDSDDVPLDGLGEGDTTEENVAPVTPKVEKPAARKG